MPDGPRKIVVSSSPIGVGARLRTSGSATWQGRCHPDEVRWTGTAGPDDKGRAMVRRLGYSVVCAAASFSLVDTSALAGGIDKSACTFGGMPLHGKVAVVDSSPDIKVQRVSSFPDLDVQKVDAFPDECGQWQFVEEFPDFTIQYVDSFPDVKVRFVDSFPGIRK